MQYDFNLAAGAGVTMDVNGKFFKYKVGTGPIRVRASNGGYVDLLPGQGVWNLNFSSLTINDRSGAQNAGVILAGDFDFHDDRIVGTVDVVDGGRTRTQIDRACVGYCGSAATAGMYSHVQLLNPAGSGINVYVSQILVGQAVASINLAQNDAPMVNLIRKGQRKRMGASESVIEMRMAQNAAQLIQGTTLGNIDPAVKLMKFSEPLMLQPGRGLLLVGSVVNDGLGGTFEFFEEPI
jgi:hypothetical protein